jgi:hypothetical protein
MRVAVWWGVAPHCCSWGIAVVSRWVGGKCEMARRGGTRECVGTENGKTNIKIKNKITTHCRSWGIAVASRWVGGAEQGRVA